MRVRAQTGGAEVSKHHPWVEGKREVVAEMWGLLLPEGDNTETIDRALSRVWAVHHLGAAGGLFGLSEFSYPALCESAVRHVILLNRIPQPDIWNRYDWMDDALDGRWVRIDNESLNALAACQAFLTQTQRGFLVSPLAYPFTVHTYFSRRQRRYRERSTD